MSANRRARRSRHSAPSRVVAQPVVTPSSKSKAKRVVEFSFAALPIFAAAFAIAEHFGLTDKLLGLDKVERVAERFHLSYAKGASRPVRSGDPEWEQTLALIKEYSKVPLKADQAPKVIARFQATLATNDPLSGAEWTAPSTPFAVLYRSWPDPPAGSFPISDATVVGSIGEIQSWIDERKSNFHFFVIDIFLTVLAAALGLWVWTSDRKQ